MNETHEHTEEQNAASEQSQEQRDQQAQAQQEAQREAEEHAARMESIRQLALSGELETSPETEEIVEALVDTVRLRDELQDRLLRAAADHQNFQRRASGNEREARTSATQGVVQSLIPLLDTFEMAMTQDPEKVSAQTVLDGVKMLRDEFMRLLGNYGVTPINPSVGDEFNPVEHAAMMQQPADGIEPGHISLVMGIGFKLGDRVVRPAKVGVVPQPEDGQALDEEA
ncbi:MAG: nucleotide exchange factor GrpE [Phycisphaerales bacterium JB052]